MGTTQQQKLKLPLHGLADKGHHFEAYTHTRTRAWNETIAAVNKRFTALMHHDDRRRVRAPSLWHVSILL